MTSVAENYDWISGYYDLMRVDLAPYVEFYHGLLQPGQASLLDLGCGTGTITVELARGLRKLTAHGKPPRVIGLDLSQAMLDVAERRDPQIDWLRGDMRDLPDCGLIDLVVCCYNSLQHLDAQGLGLAMRSVRHVLAPGGRFAFDIYRPNFDYIRIRRKDDLTRTVQAPDGSTLEIREDSEFDEALGMLQLTWRLVQAGHSGGQPLAHAVYRLWQHRPETVEAGLAAAGFEIEERYGSLHRGSWNTAAKKQVVVCRGI